MTILSLLIAVGVVALCAIAVSLGRIAAAVERAAEAIVLAAQAANNQSAPTVGTRGMGGGGR